MAQIIPENGTAEQGGGSNAQTRRRVVKSTKAPENVSIKNPMPIKVEMRDKDGRQFGLDEANGLKAKFKEALSISPEEVPSMGGGMQKLTDYIRKMDPQNSSGAVKPALDILDKLLKQGTNNPLGSIPGILGGLQGQLQQVLNQINKQNKPHNQPPQPQLCPKGQKWDPTTKACVLDPDQPDDFNNDNA